METAITLERVIDALIMYTLIRTIVWAFWRIVRPVQRLVKTEADRIIYEHAKNGHEGRLKHCTADSCASLQRLKGGRKQAQGFVAIDPLH